MTKPLAAPLAGLVPLALPGTGLPGRGAAAPVDAGLGPEPTLVEAATTGERVRAQVAAHAIAFGLTVPAAAPAETKGDITHAGGIPAALAAGEAKVAERLTAGAAAITTAQAPAARAEAQITFCSTQPGLGPGRASANGNQEGAGEGTCNRAQESTSGRRASQSTDQAIELLRVHVRFP
jgi:hypothetical protein